MRYDGVGALRIAHEIAELGRSGLTPMAAVQAATSTGVACLGIDGRTGAVKPGLEADVIVGDRNPLLDLRVLDHPVLVINDGRVAVSNIRR